MSLWDIHYAALYASPIAVDAVLTIDGTDGMVIDTGADGGPLRVIDKTAGIVTGGSGRFQSEVATLKPAAAVRAGDIAAVEPEKLQGANIVFNGKTWIVDTHGFLPAPTGEGSGEVLLYLKDR